MGRILGTVPGWVKDDGYDVISNRVYRAPGYIKFKRPGTDIDRSLLHKYKVEFDVKIYLCDTKELENPIVTRRIPGIKITWLTEEEYPGGLDAWAESVTRDEVTYLVGRSSEEVGGLMPCECSQLDGEAFKIDIVDKTYIPPVKIEVIVPPEIINAIKGYEKSAMALRDAAGRIPIPELKEDFLKRAGELENKAKELRTKYGRR